ncbi:MULTISPECIES: hypothetical protein [unclassified Streptomyces]|uniref:hypothetical protein n=1 Tax=unclassified Streptomyces TaxID=2593676 RepID=UPI0016553804|nr:hypothetical protein [Streptomyces sp. CB02980]MCB8905168.1 hypothetical protein [Streptomyces sp. CB02980]
MSGDFTDRYFTDRDERMWQQRAEERAARPLRIGARLRSLRNLESLRVSRASRTETKAPPAPARPRPVEQP